MDLFFRDGMSSKLEGMVERLRKEAPAAPRPPQPLPESPAAPPSGADGGPLRIRVDCAEDEGGPSHDGGAEDYRFLYEACQEIADTYLARDDALKLGDSRSTPTSVLLLGDWRAPAETGGGRWRAPDVRCVRL